MDRSKSEQGTLTMDKLLKLRNEKKAKKPTFVQQCSHKISKIASKWRRPRGIQSKMRLKHKGKKKSPSLGYSSPRKVRGLNRIGLKEVLVQRVSDLEGFDSKTQTVVVAHVGTKKRVEILSACVAKGYDVSNVKDIQGFIKEVKEDMEDRKKDKKKRADKKKKVEDALKKKKDKKEEKKKEEVVEPQHETKKGQKSDKIKLLEGGQ
tara:strand:- start:2072 stop:2689 length:618 start_codon:yes stop_codon:yes gene_type:complete